MVLVSVLGLLAVGLFAARHLLLRQIALAFRVDNPAPSGLLVILLGGLDHRPDCAARLYAQGLAPVVVFGTTGPLPVVGVSETELTRRRLRSRGVPESALRVLPGLVASTYDEAVRVRDYLQTHPTRRITLVTTSFHTARARWVFRKVLRGMNVEVRAAACPDPRFNESNWYRSEDGFVLYAEEFLKTIYYRLAH